jgi:hypothetical protein
MLDGYLYINDYRLFVKEFIPWIHLQCDQQRLNYCRTKPRAEVNRFSVLEPRSKGLCSKRFRTPLTRSSPPRLWCRFLCVKAAEHILSDVTKSASISSAPAVSMTQTAVLPKPLHDAVNIMDTGTFIPASGKDTSCLLNKYQPVSAV